MIIDKNFESTVKISWTENEIDFNRDFNGPWRWSLFGNKIYYKKGSVVELVDTLDSKSSA